MGNNGPERKEAPSKGPQASRSPWTRGERAIQGLLQGSRPEARTAGCMRGRNGCRRDKKASESGCLVWGWGQQRQDGIRAGEEGRFSGDTRTSYKPRSHMPKFGSVWEDPPEFRQKEGGGGREEAEARFILLTELFTAHTCTSSRINPLSQRLLT